MLLFSRVFVITEGTSNKKMTLTKFICHVRVSIRTYGVYEKFVHVKYGTVSKNTNQNYILMITFRVDLPEPKEIALRRVVT
jgi:hypothetical protein